jgi:hypothetical protein
MIWPPDLAAKTPFHPSGPGPGEHTKQQWDPRVHLSGTTLRSTEFRVFNLLKPSTLNVVIAFQFRPQRFFTSSAFRVQNVQYVFMFFAWSPFGRHTWGSNIPVDENVGCQFLALLER